jgi:2-hydroxyglutarate dehydrogenase
MHQTTHNSGVIHRGVYYRPDSLKAKLCVSGALQMVDFCRAHGITVRQVGKLIVAASYSQLSALESLESRARANEVPIHRLDEEGMRAVEPHVRGIAALHSPTTAIVDFAEVARNLGDDLRKTGVRIVLGCPIAKVVHNQSGITLVHAGGYTVADRVVFCAGSWSDQFVQSPGDIRIVPFRGRYLRLKQPWHDIVRGLVYPVPDPEFPFLGVHITPHVDGHLSIGPTALPAMRHGVVDRSVAGALRSVRATATWPGTYRMGWRWRSSAAREFRNAVSRRAVVREASRLVPIPLRAVEPGDSGIRAQAVHRSGAIIDDFVFAVEGRAVHVRSAPSPAATACLAIADVIVDRVVQAVPD